MTNFKKSQKTRDYKYFSAHSSFYHLNSNTIEVLPPTPLVKAFNEAIYQPRVRWQSKSEWVDKKPPFHVARYNPPKCPKVAWAKIYRPTLLTKTLDLVKGLYSAFKRVLKRRRAIGRLTQ